MNRKEKDYTITYMKQNINKNLKIFGERIKDIRKSKSESLNKIAFSRGGVTSATLSRIENGLVDFKFSTLLHLAHTLNEPLIKLFEGFEYNEIEED